MVSPVTRLMCAWLIGSIHSPACFALYSQSAFAGCTWQRAADDPREDAPAEAGGEQRPTADDHHVRTRKVADEMSRVAHARERLRDPRHVLHDHVQAAEHEEEASGDEVLREPAVV